jgi:hypothetical protein
MAERKYISLGLLTLFCGLITSSLVWLILGVLVEYFDIYIEAKWLGLISIILGYSLTAGLAAKQIYEN